MSENKKKDSKSGFNLTDEPSKEDKLEISKHIKGLSKFLITCDTPMTVSIQGEWGTGKSTIMGQLMEQTKVDAEEDISNIWFDTWQYSQFSFDDQLPIILLERLVSKISKDDSFEKNGKANARKALKSIKTMGRNITAAGKTGANAFTQFNLNVSLFVDAKENSIKRMYQRIEEFKSTFEDLINDSSRDRFIIYIDDLDRLAPEKAVELLEVLKIFLDVDKCVFVLAIDHDVVVRGVADKYGFDMNNPEEYEKGKNFFDKIIQVPYSVPLEDYKLDDFIKAFLENENLENESETVNNYKNLLVSSVGKNPRSIKRVFNMFKLNRHIKAIPYKDEKQKEKEKDTSTTNDSEDSSVKPNIKNLLKKIFNKTKRFFKKIFNMHNEETSSDDKDKHNNKKEDLVENLLLFMFTCMQNKYRFTYSYIINIEGNTKDNIDNLLDEEINEEFLNISELKEEFDKENHKKFLSKIKEIIKDVDEAILDKVVDYSKNTFINKKDKTSTAMVFETLESLLKYDFKKKGKEISYPKKNIEIMENEIISISGEIEKEYNATKSYTAILFKINKSIIAEIHIYTNTFSVKCIVNSKLKDNENIKNIIDKHEDLKLTTGNRITFNVNKLNILKNNKNKEDLMKVISIIANNKSVLKK